MDDGRSVPIPGFLFLSLPFVVRMFCPVRFSFSEFFSFTRSLPGVKWLMLNCLREWCLNRVSGFREHAMLPNC